MILKERISQLCTTHGCPIGGASGAPWVEVHGLLYLGDFVHDDAWAAEVVFEQIVFGFCGLRAAAVERLLDDQVADGALPFFAAVGVGDFFNRAYVKRVGNTAITAVGIGAAIAASVWPVFKFNFVAAFDDLTGFVEAGVADGAAVSADIVAIGVVGVGLTASAGDSMGAGIACAVAIVANITFVGDIADGVVG